MHVTACIEQLTQIMVTERCIDTSTLTYERARARVCVCVCVCVRVYKNTSSDLQKTDIQAYNRNVSLLYLCETGLTVTPSDLYKHRS